MLFNDYESVSFGQTSQLYQRIYRLKHTETIKPNPRYSMNTSPYPLVLVLLLTPPPPRLGHIECARMLVELGNANIHLRDLDNFRSSIDWLSITVSYHSFFFFFFFFLFFFFSFFFFFFFLFFLFSFFFLFYFFFFLKRIAPR